MGGGGEEKRGRLLAIGCVPTRVGSVKRAANCLVSSSLSSSSAIKIKWNGEPLEWFAVENADWEEKTSWSLLAHAGILLTPIARNKRYTRDWESV